jgi:small basic protein (TIGR04137 family)
VALIASEIRGDSLGFEQLFRTCADSTSWYAPSPFDYAGGSFTFNFLTIMSQHSSLKRSSGAVGAKRTVLKRFERVKLLKQRGQWKTGTTPVGLPKTKPEA